MDKETDDSVVSIDRNKPYSVYQCLCTKCGFQWIGVLPENVDRTQLECAECGVQRSFAVHTHEADIQMEGK